MEKQEKKFQIFFVYAIFGAVFIILCVIIFLKLFVFQNSISVIDQSTKSPGALKKEVVVDPELALQYQKEVGGIVRQYEAGKNTLEIYEKLLNVVVPSAQFKDIHLDLVIIFDQLSRAYDAKDQEKIQQLTIRLEQVKKANPYLQ